MVPGFMDLSQTKSLTTHDNHKSFQLMHVERREHDSSLVSARSVSGRPGVFYQDAQAIFWPHPRQCNVVSHHLMAYGGNVRYLKGPRSEQISWIGISQSFFPTAETNTKL